MEYSIYCNRCGKDQTDKENLKKILPGCVKLKDFLEYHRVMKIIIELDGCPECSDKKLTETKIKIKTRSLPKENSVAGTSKS